MIELWGMQSPNVQKVVMALEELGLAYQFHYVDVFMNENHSADFTALTPNRKVPVIIDHDAGGSAPIKLWESGAILIYLAEKTGRLLPADPNARYAALQWLMFQMASVGPMFGQHSHFRFFAKDERHAYSRTRYATEVKRIYDVVEYRLSETRYLAGDEYSIADIACWPWMQGAAPRGIDLDVIPNVLRWAEEIRQRAATGQMLEWIAAQKGYDFDRFAVEHPDNLDRYLGRGKYSRP